MMRTAFLLVSLSMLPAGFAAPVRERLNFDAGWRFSKGDAPGAERTGFDDAGWRKLNLPHDWSIEGPYSAANASGTGFLPGGIGWYRKTFRLDASLAGRRIYLAFDGVYRDSDVWINGHHLGHRPYGYSSFEYELTPYLAFGATANVVAVRVDHSVTADSRFYTGSGIYRHVWLTLTQPVHVAHWGTYVYTPVAGAREALVSVETRVQDGSAGGAAVRVVTTIEDAAGKEAGNAASEERIAAGGEHAFVQQAVVSNPRLWSTDDPNLYTAANAAVLAPDGGTVLATSPGLGTSPNATLAGKEFYTNGIATVGMWGRDATMGPNILAVRQNLILLIDGGKEATNLDQNSLANWGYTVHNATLVWRSGVGVDAKGHIIYAAGSGLSVHSLADVLLAAGCVRAMELDINSEWVDFYSYATNPTVAGGVGATKLIPDMQPPLDRYFEPSDRDFIAAFIRTVF